VPSSEGRRRLSGSRPYATGSCRARTAKSAIVGDAWGRGGPDSADLRALSPRLIPGPNASREEKGEGEERGGKRERSRGRVSVVVGAGL